MLFPLNPPLNASISFQEKKELEIRITQLEERINEMENKCKNQMTELIAVKSESDNWEKQLELEKKKLKKLEEEKKALKEEV